MTRIITGWAVLTLTLAGCDHSLPYQLVGQGSAGPLSEATELRVTYGTGIYFAVSWSEDGKSLLLSDSTKLSLNSCRAIRGSDVRKSGCVNDTCLEVVPADGGSGLIHFCESAGGHADSTDLITGAALASDGRLLYDEVSGRSDFEFPIGYHAELWLADSAMPGSPRRRLRSMGADGLVFELAATKWVASTEFVAFEQSVSASQGVGVQPVGLVHGVIQRDTTLLRIIPATRGVRSFGVAEGGASIVYSNGDVALHRVSLSNGGETSWGVLPAAPGRSVRDIRCDGDRCLVVTDDSIPLHPTYSLWRVALGGSVSLMRTFRPDEAFRVIAIGPDGRLAVTRNGVVYLVTSPP